MSTVTRQMSMTDTLPGISRQYIDYVRMFLASLPSGTASDDPIAKEVVQASFLERLPEELRIDPDKAAHTAELERWKKALNQLGWVQVPARTVVPTDADSPVKEKPAYYAVQMELPYDEFIATKAKDWKGSITDQKKVYKSAVQYVEEHADRHYSVRNVMRDIKNAAK